jgi:hypothetical protein
MSLQPSIADQREMRGADPGKFGPGRDRRLTVIRLEGRFAAHQPGSWMQSVGFERQIDLLTRPSAARRSLQALVGARLFGHLAVQMRDQPALVGTGVALQALGKFDGSWPVANHLRDIEAMLQGCALVGRFFESVEGLFGAVEQTGTQEVGAKLEERVFALRGLKVSPCEQALMDANRPVGLATTAKQIAEGEVKFDGFRIELDHVNEGIDRLVRLLVEQKIQALEIGIGQMSRLTNLRPGIDARCEPAQRKKQRDDA